MWPTARKQTPAGIRSGHEGSHYFRSDRSIMLAMGHIPGEPASARTETLNYSSSPRKSRSRTRWAVAGMIAIVAALAAWRYGPHAYSWARTFYWERPCMDFDPPPQTAVYERLPAGSAKPAIARPFLDGDSREVAAISSDLVKRFVQGPPPVMAWRVPLCWVRFLQASGNAPSPVPPVAVLFCHWRVSPAGHKRLVVVEMSSFCDIGDLLAKELAPSIYARPGWNGCPALRSNGQSRQFNGSFIPMPRRVFAGQPDPADASRFTIAYEWPDGVRGTIDGRLLDDDTVDLTVRPGPGDLKSARDSYSHGRWKK